MITKKHILVLICCLAVSGSIFAGNKDRVGQAAATELLINPWGASGSLFALNVANVRGLEALKCNIAGLANLKGTEIGIAHSRYLAGAGISNSNVGFAQKMGESGALAVNLMTFSFGDIPITTSNSPEGNIGTFRPQFFNASVGYAYKLSNSTSAGINVTFVNEAISNIRASAIGLDAGIQYKSGERDNFKLGIALKNVGTNLRFVGDGFSFNGISPEFGKEITVQSRSDKFNLPSQLQLGVSYDFYLDQNKKNLDENGDPTDVAYEPIHRLTAMYSFVSNSFNKDWNGIGFEYAYDEKFFLRTSYRYESGILDPAESTTFYSGLAAGIGVVAGYNEDTGTALAIDYAYKHTRIEAGVHTVGLRIRFGGGQEEEVPE